MIIATYKAKRGPFKGITQFIKEAKGLKQPFRLVQDRADATVFDDQHQAEIALNLELTDGIGPGSQYSYEEIGADVVHGVEGMIDIAPRQEHIPTVEITIGVNKEVWVNVDGVCRFRAKGCHVVTAENYRLDNKRGHIRKSRRAS